MEKHTKEFITSIERHVGIVHKIARLYCRNESDRADLIQDIYHQLWRSYPTFNPSMKFSTWMYRVALNTAISAYRKRSMHDFREFDESRFETNSATDEQSESLVEAIGTLPSLDKALIMLHLDEHRYEEIAEIMGMSTTNVATRLSRIKKRLKEILVPQNKQYES